ncbi:hypothetical protein CHCC14821_4313 [Bacillus paralicheniformis]|nr:hypothetical protein CHCC14821_4313 [Bacillus paralicheniformis]TWM56354.1 hypothetical protein CHCC14814_2335 [Bacillus paralicheniformis]
MHWTPPLGDKSGKKANSTLEYIFSRLFMFFCFYMMKWLFSMMHMNQ